MRQEQHETAIVQIYQDLESDKDLMVIMVDLFDLLHTHHSDKKKIIDFIQVELRGYPSDFAVNHIPHYRKIPIDNFEFQQDSELLGIKKVINRLEGKTIITQSLEDIRNFCTLAPIEENLYVQNKKYEWEEIEVRGQVNNLLGGTDNKKTYPKKVNSKILNNIEEGIRKNLKHRLKAYFPEIQQQLFDIKIENMKLELQHLKDREREFSQALRFTLWVQRVWVYYLCSKDKEFNWYVCGICMSKRKANQIADRLYNFFKAFFATKGRTIATLLSSIGVGALTYDEIIKLIEEILKIISL